jgi:hypothetical protein
MKDLIMKQLCEFISEDIGDVLLGNEEGIFVKNATK